MASCHSKKKQDDKNLKTLRELVSLPHNKECFDCNQRGPTYINMTIGSFVCTTCSGILRGLNPPHRIKSITMASFNPEEIDMIKSRGNEVCRKIWLGNCSQHSYPEFHEKNEMHLKDLMILKYEKKKFYVDPVTAIQDNSRSADCNVSNASNGVDNVLIKSSSNPDIVPLLEQKSATTASRNLRAGVNYQKPVQKSETVKTNEFPIPLFDAFSETVNSTESNGKFANFDDNPLFGTHIAETKERNSNLSSKPWNDKSASSIPSDRYAALAELDNEFKSHTNVDCDKSNPTSWNMESFTRMTNSNQQSFPQSSFLFPLAMQKPSPTFYPGVNSPTTAIQTLAPDNLSGSILSANPFNSSIGSKVCKPGNVTCGSTGPFLNPSLPNGYSSGTYCPISTDQCFQSTSHPLIQFTQGLGQNKLETMPHGWSAISLQAMPANPFLVREELQRELEAVEVKSMLWMEKFTKNPPIPLKQLQK